MTHVAIVVENKIHHNNKHHEARGGNGTEDD